MRSFNHSSEILKLLNTREYKNLGLVPTMGSLHKGHIKLIEKCSSKCDETIVSIFVNPTQFNNKKDLANYPQSIKNDIQIIKKINPNTIIYTPMESDLYTSPPKAQIFDLDGIDKIIEGKFRKGHFEEFHARQTQRKVDETKSDWQRKKTELCPYSYAQND